jgi:hypothetical protein
MAITIVTEQHIIWSRAKKLFFFPWQSQSELFIGEWTWTFHSPLAECKPLVILELPLRLDSDLAWWWDILYKAPTLVQVAAIHFMCWFCPFGSGWSRILTWGIFVGLKLSIIYSNVAKKFWNKKWIVTRKEILVFIWRIQDYNLPRVERISYLSLCQVLLPAASNAQLSIWTEVNLCRSWIVFILAKLKPVTQAEAKR